MFKRDIITELQKWATKTNRKPLVLRGARQVGKTTVVQMFSKEFDQYIYLNLEKKNSVRFLSEIILLPIYLPRFSCLHKNYAMAAKH